MFVEVILPLALPGTFTYHVPAELKDDIATGKRVIVQFGKHKIYTAVVKNITSVSSVNVDTKPVISILDDLPVVTQQQLDYWQWMSDYYLCTPGEILAAALPSALRLQSETTLVLHPDFLPDSIQLSEREHQIVEALEKEKQLTVADVSKLLSLKQVMPVIKSLISKNVIQVAEELTERYKPRYAVFVSMTETAKNEQFMQELMQALERKAPKQLDLLLNYIRLQQDEEKDSIAQTYLLKKAKSTSTILQSLVKKGVFELAERSVDRQDFNISEVQPPFILNPGQQQAYLEIQDAFNEQKVVLLHGVTSSGKTEIYIHLLQEALLKGKQSLYLVPEIALTTQVINRLRKHFGNKLLVYHSRFNDQERVEVWNKVLDHQYKIQSEGQVIIGARSAIFLPFHNLDLIIVDEEHDSSYKQTDPAPRYNARDSAVLLASRMKANVLLGSATPSLESYYNALAKKYCMVTLEKRFGEMIMPDVTIIDVRDALKRKQMHSHFSAKLLDMMKIALDAGEQVILFQNRRGFAPVLECKNCSWVPHCINCDVSLTLHKQHGQLRCHYCGYSISPPSSCSACGSTDLRMKGFGTEKVEEELQALFPDHQIARLDHDTAKSKRSFHRLITDFENGDIDVLVGTQMVTKGLDFEKVSLVGILNADQLLNYPDFRAHERSFQLMEQVSGRAGRKNVSGKVAIQTYNPTNVILKYVLNHDFKGFYNHELIDRNKFDYPPYYRLIECTIKHKEEAEADRAAKVLAKELTEVFGKRVLGPTHPNIGRIRNHYLRQVMIKLERKLSVQQVKQRLQKALDFFQKTPENRSVILQVDVDPQ